MPTVSCTTTPPPPPADYDCTKEAHFTGTIASFLNVPCSTGETGFVIRLDNLEKLTVLNGPQSYATNMNFCANIGDTVDVLGVPDASGNILARQITWQGQTFAFRSDQGYPLWSGPASGSFAQYNAAWDRERMETLSGRVIWANLYYPGGSCMQPGIEVALDTGMALSSDMVPDWKAEQTFFTTITPTIVQLGPQWAVNQMLPGLEPGQYVTVTGVSMGYNGAQLVVASEVKRRGETMVAFRSPNGTPMWAGGWLGWCSAPVAVGFNPCNLETVCGMVQQIANTEIAPGMGIHEIVVLQTADNRMLRVDLGPQWFLQQQGIALQCGQTVTVTGSTADIGGQPTLFATNIQANGDQFALRSDTGVPTWSVAMTCPLTVTASSSAFSPAPQAMAPPTTAVASAAVAPAPAAAPMPPAPSGTASY